MTAPFAVAPARTQPALPGEPYDCWITGDGTVMAEFHRLAHGYLVRFPDQADFTIDAGSLAVTCHPCTGMNAEAIEALFDNAIVPIVGNHCGGINLHGSAVAFGEVGVAFMGRSRRGKTTLAAACARAGHPFLAEDLVQLEERECGWTVAPQRPFLRLFPDSAHHVTGMQAATDSAEGKQRIDAGADLPFRQTPARLGAIMLLGPGEADAVAISRLPDAQALAELLQQAFVLDVETRSDCVPISDG